MTFPKQIFELVEEIRDLADKATTDEARSALIYCVKQLKISVASRRQEERDDDDEDFRHEDDGLEIDDD